MRIFTRETWLADLFVLAGLCLLGAALWLAWGWPAALAYVGTVLVVCGVVLAHSDREVAA